MKHKIASIWEHVLHLFPRLDIFSCWRADVNDVGLISITTYTQSLTHTHTGAICLILAALAHRDKWISQTRQKMISHILAISYFTFHLFQVSINDYEFNDNGQKVENNNFLKMEWVGKFKIHNDFLNFPALHFLFRK